MSISLRIILIAVSVLTVVFMISKIRKAKLQIEYAIFWLGFSVLLLVFSIFPQIAMWMSDICGIESPANFIFHFVIFILLINQFNMTIKLSNAESRTAGIIQETAIREKMKKDEKCD